MIYRRSACVFLALLMANGVAAQAPPDSDKNAGTHQTEFDLTGYWQQDGGQIFYFAQEGSSLTSRHMQRAAGNDERDIDFTATVHGNLIYGAHRASFSRVLRAKCSNQIWVGMGLTVNDDRTELTGFRGDRIVDPKTCNVKDSAPVGLVYKRIDEAEPLN